MARCKRAEGGQWHAQASGGNQTQTSAIVRAEGPQGDERGGRIQRPQRHGAIVDATNGREVRPADTRRAQPVDAGRVARHAAQQLVGAQVPGSNLAVATAADQHVAQQRQREHAARVLGELVDERAGARVPRQQPVVVRAREEHAPLRVRLHAVDPRGVLLVLVHARARAEVPQPHGGVVAARRQQRLRQGVQRHHAVHGAAVPLQHLGLARTLVIQLPQPQRFVLRARHRPRAIQPAHALHRQHVAYTSASAHCQAQISSQHAAYRGECAAFGWWANATRARWRPCRPTAGGRRAPPCTARMRRVPAAPRASSPRAASSAPARAACAGRTVSQTDAHHGSAAYLIKAVFVYDDEAGCEMVFQAHLRTANPKHTDIAMSQSHKRDQIASARSAPLKSLSSAASACQCLHTRLTFRVTSSQGT